MKKITALVLALIMTLSLLPMNVWATGTEQESQQDNVSSPTDVAQLYWKYNPKDSAWSYGSLSNCFGGSSWLTLATDKDGTALPEGWTVSATPTDIGNIFKTPDGQLCWDHSGVREHAEGKITVTSGGIDYTADVYVGDWPIEARINDKVQYANFDNGYFYTSGKDVTIEFDVGDDMSITGVTGIDSSWFSIDSSDKTKATLTIPSNAAGPQEFKVFYNWLENGNIVQTGERYFRFFDTNDNSDLFCRAVWENGKEGWNGSRYYVSADEMMTVEFALPPQDGSRPADDAVMSLAGASVAVTCSNNTAESPKNLGTVEISGNKVLWDCTAAIPGSMGVLTITKGEKTYNVPVEITPAFIGVYSATPDNSDLSKNYMTRNNNWCYTYTPGAAQAQTLYLLACDNVTFLSEADGYAWPEGFAIVENSDNRLATYIIPADTYGTDRITIMVKLRTGETTWEDRSWELGLTEAERHTEVVGSDGLTTDDKPYRPMPIGDTGYYIAPIGYLYGEIRALGGGWQSFHEDGRIESAIAVGFWKMGADGVTLELLEGEELAAVSGKFNKSGTTETTLKMSIKLAADSNAENTRYPSERKISPTNDTEYHSVFVSPNAYPLAKIYQFNKNSAGAWIYEVTGTYTDGEKRFDVTAYGRDEKRTEKQDYVNIPAQSTPEETVAYINNFLQQYEGSNSEYKAIHLGINLPAGELKGYIEVPKKNYNVFFNGAMDANGNLLTTLEGGIFASNADTRATNVRFVGAGRDEKDWSKAETWNGSKLPNKAFYGEAGGGVYHCSFIGYDCAIEMNGGVIGAGGNTDHDGVPVGDTGCFFYNNEVAIKVNIPNGSDFMGDSQYWKMVMVNNGTDFDFEDVGDGSGYWVNISRTIFVRNDNKNSIHNTGGRTFFMPLNTFYNTKSDSNNGNNDPKVDGNVSIAPYYTLSDVGKQALVTDLDVEAMLANPTYKEEWIVQERLFPRSWICPANPNKELYSVDSDNITEDEMTIDIIDNADDDAYVGTIKLKKDK